MKEQYKHISTKEKYNMLLKTGFFFEFHPELTGNWELDSPLIKGSGKRNTKSIIP